MYFREDTDVGRRVQIDRSIILVLVIFHVTIPLPPV